MNNSQYDNTRATIFIGIGTQVSIFSCVTGFLITGSDPLAGLMLKAVGLPTLAIWLILLCNMFYKEVKE